MSEVADNPIIALTTPTGLCVWWGLQRLCTLRCQKAGQGMEVHTLTAVMALRVTLLEARAWFFNTKQHEAANTVEKLSIWF